MNATEQFRSALETIASFPDNDDDHERIMTFRWKAVGEARNVLKAHPSDKKYVIYSEEEDGYWHNDEGWMDEVDSEDSSMIFSDKERWTLNLPIGGKWEEYELPTE
jgi:hypothetical protein